MKIALLAAALATALAGVAIAAPQTADNAAQPRVALDANRDGAIDRAEAAQRPRLAERFDTLDANKDGRLDRSERPHRAGRDGKRGMTKIDTDRDGRISRAEAAAHPKFAARFDTLDANKDGVLDAGERPRHRGKGDRPKLDVDGDGRITQAEAASHPRLKERFATIDANRDGALSREELQQARQARRESNAPR